MANWARRGLWAPVSEFAAKCRVRGWRATSREAVEGLRLCGEALIQLPDALRRITGRSEERIFTFIYVFVFASVLFSDFEAKEPFLLRLVYCGVLAFLVTGMAAYFVRLAPTILTLLFLYCALTIAHWVWTTIGAVLG